MRILVTGGGGFIGSAVTRRLLREGHQLRVYQRSDASQLAAEGVEVYRGDLQDREAMGRAVEGCEAVFHVAARAGMGGRIEDFWGPNVAGTRCVLERAAGAGVRYLVHTSTPSVVFNGRPIEGGHESMPYCQSRLSPYAYTKARAEELVLGRANDPLDLGGMRRCALRPHLVWGPGDPHLLPRVINRAKSGRLRIVGHGLNRVDITRIENVAEAHYLALQALIEGKADGKAYFLSQGAPVLLWPWINELLTKLGLAPVRNRVPLAVASGVGLVADGIWNAFRLPGDPPMTRFVAMELAKHHWFDISAARMDLAYFPEQYPTDEGVDAYVASLSG